MNSLTLFGLGICWILCAVLNVIVRNLILKDPKLFLERSKEITKVFVVVGTAMIVTSLIFIFFKGI